MWLMSRSGSSPHWRQPLASACWRPVRSQALAAPIALDLALFLDLAVRAEMSGIQEWLSFFLKSPMHADGIYPEHDLFIQQTKLKNTLRWMMGEEQITHLGLEYYLTPAEAGRE